MRNLRRMWDMVREYRRLRRVASGVSFGRVEAFGLSIANVESRSRLRGDSAGRDRVGGVQ